MAKQNVVVPSVGESVTEVTVARLLVQDGFVVHENAPVIELESDKASVEVPAPCAGKVRFMVKAGDIVHIGSVLAEIDETVSPAPPADLQENAGAAPSTMPEGIRKSMESYLRTPQQENVPVAPYPHDAPLPPKEGEIRKPMSRLRKTIAKRLVEVKNRTAMLTTFNEVDMSRVMAVRTGEKEAFQKKYGAKLTYLPFFIKAVSSALEAFPDVNAFLDGDDIVYNKSAHIGIAVSTGSGLVVPVIRNAESLGFGALAKEIEKMAAKAREKKLSIEDMSGGTFTITNGGVFGSMLSTPILNPPQSAILGMHNIVERPVAIEGKVEIRPIMYLALSYDHRVIDGKESVSFLVHVKEMLEDPSKFYLYG